MVILNITHIRNIDNDRGSIFPLNMQCNVLEINQTNLTGGVITQGNTTQFI